MKKRNKWNGIPRWSGYVAPPWLSGGYDRFHGINSASDTSLMDKVSTIIKSGQKESKGRGGKTSILNKIKRLWDNE